MSYAAVKELVAAHFPKTHLRPQTVQEWTGAIDLPQPIQRYYAEFGPINGELPNYGNNFFLPSLAQLWPYQAGYRWDAGTHKRLSDWNDEWIVLADIGSDPLIFSRTDHTILHAYHGQGTWKPQPLFTNIDTMVYALVSLGIIVQTAGNDFTDEAAFIKQEHLQEAQRQLNKVVSIKEADDILQRLEWRVE